MSEIHLINHHAITCTVVSNHFIEYYMPQANGEFVKVYLCLLRSLQEANPKCSISEIADLLNHTEADIVRAIRYWEKKGLLSLEIAADQSIIGICFCDPDATTDHTAAVTPSTAPLAPAAPPALHAEADSAVETAPAVAEPQEPRSYTADEITAFSQNPDIEELFFVIATYIKHPLTSSDTNFILFWYDNLKFSTELITYLVEYCISKNHSSLRYMNKVALAWREEGIETVADAKENAAIHSQTYYSVMKAMGITGRNLVPAENDFIARWTGEYGYSNEIIQEACSRTISATHQPSFEYTDSILSNWLKKGVRTFEDIKAVDEQFAQKKKAAVNKGNGTGKNGFSPAEHPANRFNNFSQRNYDEDELERMLLNRPHNN